MEISKKNKNKVLLGLSGGVDSTTAALLLKEHGYEVIGYYFDVLGNNKRGLQEAEEAARQLGIELIFEDVSEDFENTVINNFCNEYMCGRTPNPCIICNPNIKFKRLIEKANEIDAYYIATGHYCRISYDESRAKYFVKMSANAKKDQSYMLYRLEQEVLSRLIFPLGEFSDKAHARDLARKNNLKNADKKDSQEICFIPPDEDYADFIRSRGIISEPGYFVDKSGSILGSHRGIINYTVGQRKGLGIALGKPAFVVKIDPEKNQVTLGDNKELQGNSVICTDYFFTAGDAAEYDGKIVSAKVRYSAKVAEALIKVDDKKITATFREAQRAATPGQSIVFYDGDKVIGGGFIQGGL